MPFFLHMQEGDSVKDAVLQVPTAQPCTIVKGTLDNIKDAVLVVEKELIACIPPAELPLVLVSAFYAYNMHYTEGCTNLYTFFEIVFFKAKKPAKKTRLTAVLARLTPQY